jgi:hypothetical protein
MKLLDKLRESLARTLRVPEGQALPVAIVWTDATGEWCSLAPVLRAAMPEFFTWGDYRPEQRMGPAIWLKCVVERTLPEAPALGTTPILYLPNVSRQTLRAAADCPPQWAPLIELQYRGRVWHQSNGRDWTVMAFLTSNEGLGLEIAQDKRTEEAIGRNLPLLVDVDIHTMSGRRLDADDFDRLSVSDPIRDLLQWLNAPERFEESQADRWVAFRNRCQSEFGIDPADGTEAAIKAIAEGDHGLDPVWLRFSESPASYPGVSKLLRTPGSLAIDESRNPAINESEEAELRKDLEVLAGLDQATAAARVQALEAQHGVRRTWVWARTGLSPWAMALEPLVTLAKLSKSPIGGATVEAAAEIYASSGYLCDWAAIDALSRFRETSSDASTMKRVVQVLYEPWLDASARHFQELVRKAGKLVVSTVPFEHDVCTLFIDGMRFDIGAAMAAELEQRGLIARVGFRFSPLPTVTATAKAVVMTIPGQLHGASAEDFTPLLGIKQATAPVLRNALSARGVEIFENSETRFPSGAASGGWAEFGAIDSYGHAHPDDLAIRAKTEVINAADRVKQLLDAGWKKVRVVTDHGWLLLPKGLPKVDLPAYLTATKWARCALAKADAPVPSYPWHWNPDIRITSPQGIASFRAGDKYAHGGVSLQECVVPEIVVEHGVEAVHASILSVEWRGMRCKVKVETNDPTVRVDLRTYWKQVGSSIVAAIKEVGAGGEANLVVVDDKHEGSAAMVVLIDSGGAVLSQKSTSVGEK